MEPNLIMNRNRLLALVFSLMLICGASNILASDTPITNRDSDTPITNVTSASDTPITNRTAASQQDFTVEFLKELFSKFLNLVK